MKPIFREDKRVGASVVRWYRKAQYDTWGGYSPDGVETSETGVIGTATAFWDEGTGVLYAYGLANTKDLSWAQDMERPELLCVVPRRSDALRRAIAFADNWYADLAAAIPAPDVRSDEQVKADYEADQAAA